MSNRNDVTWDEEEDLDNEETPESGDDDGDLVPTLDGDDDWGDDEDQ